MIDLNAPMNCPSTPPDSTKVHHLGTQTIECEDCAKWNNWCRLILTPTPLGNTPTKEKIEHNQRSAFEWVSKSKHVADMSLDELFIWMKKVEAIAAGASLAYNNRLIKNRVARPDDAERAIEFKDAVKKQKDENRPKKERVLLSDREKAIKALIDIGMDAVIAAKSVDERMASVGRNPG